MDAITRWLRNECGASTGIAASSRRLQWGCINHRRRAVHRQATAFCATRAIRESSLSPRAIRSRIPRMRGSSAPRLTFIQQSVTQQHLQLAPTIPSPRYLKFRRSVRRYSNEWREFITVIGAIINSSAPISTISDVKIERDFELQRGN